MTMAPSTPACPVCIGAGGWSASDGHPMRATSLAPVTLNRVSCLYCGGSGELGAVEDGRPVPTVRTPEEHTYTAIHEAAEAHDRRYVELLLMGYDIAAERHIRARDALLSEVVD